MYYCGERLVVMFALRTTASLQRDKEVTPDATYITQSLTEPTVSQAMVVKKVEAVPNFGYKS